MADDKMREAAESLVKIVLDQCFGYTNGPGYEAAQAARVLKAALAERPAQGEAVDKGPWHAVAEHDNPVTGVWIESDDFAHDVRLYVNGDFADQGQRLAYAKRIADCLMNDWDEGWMQGWDDCRAGTPTPNRIR